MERETRFELATFALARQRSTTEPFPQSGGNNRARTYDPLLVRQMLSQLSYASKPELLVYNTKLKKKLQLFFGGFSKKIKKIKKSKVRIICRVLFRWDISLALNMTYFFLHVILSMSSKQTCLQGFASDDIHKAQAFCKNAKNESFNAAALCALY